MSRILVVGGGYVGTHVVERMVEAGHDVVALDGPAPAGRALARPGAVTIHADLRSHETIAAVLDSVAPDVVVDVAMYADPQGLVSHGLLRAAAEGEAVPMVFTSSSAVYGAPEVDTVDESLSAPTCESARAVREVEEAHECANRHERLSSIRLRCFEICGAHRSGRLGPAGAARALLMNAAVLAAFGQAPPLKVGASFATPDGTAVRDFVHVEDVADAHVLAVEALLDGVDGATFNVGLGIGWSVRQVIGAVERVTGRDVPTVVAALRPGEASRLVADNTAICERLGWTPLYRDIDRIAETAADWFAGQTDRRFKEVSHVPSSPRRHGRRWAGDGAPVARRQAGVGRGQR